MNEEIEEDGLWEVDITSWMENSKDIDKAFKAVENHAVVDDFYDTKESYTKLEAQDGVSFYEITSNGKTFRSKALSSYKGNGNIDLISRYDKEEWDIVNNNNDADGAYLPNVFSEMGYSVGDTVTFTVCPVMASYDESSQIMKDVRAEMKEKYGTEYTDKEPEYEELSDELKKKAFKGNLLNLILRHTNSLDDVPVKDKVYGKPVEYTVKIAGFTNYKINMVLANYEFNLINTKNTDVNFLEVGEKNPDIYVEQTNSMVIRLIDNCDYDEALKRLFTDLGFDYDTQFLDSVEFPLDTNDMLLALEWKSPYAIYKSLALIMIPMLVVLLIAWFVARFVIDNAFEMAVQERSTHFAALRIMGASKAQIAFLVFAEALFYCFTAVPLGTILAMLLCRSSFNAIKNVSLPIFEFKINALITAIGVALCLVAILISAYTSAMWASRKLSPAEALNFGKPKSRKRRFRKSRSKLDMSANRFLRRYTRKNIKTAKSRFIVSTITMGLGVLMFTFTVLTGTYIKNKLEMIRNPQYADMEIIGYYSDDPEHPTELTDKYFGNKEIFSKYAISGAIYNITLDEESRKTINEKLVLLEGKQITTPHFFAINKGVYLFDELDKVTGMSYEEFLNSDGVIFNMSNMKYDEEIGWDKEYCDRKYVKTDNISLNINGKKYNVIGTALSPAGTGIIIPIEKSAESNIEYNITLRISDYKHYPEALKLYDEFLSQTTYDFSENMFMIGTGVTEFVNDIIKIIIGFLVSIWLVGILSMINSVNTSVLNRSRELMMLRSVGMSRKQLRKSVMLETIMFSSTAAITGTALGVGGFLAFIFMLIKDNSAAVWGMVALTVTVSIAVNIIIAMIAAIPAIKNLNKVEAIAQASNS